MKVKVFVLDDGHNNAGDMITKPILEHFGYRVEPVGYEETGKLVGVGSIITEVAPGDYVWGTGSMYDKKIDIPYANILAVRGKLTRKLITGSHVPQVYGDPGLLISLVYNPEVEVMHDVGVIPHYVDKHLVKVNENEHFIDIQADWRTVVREIKSCRSIVSSTLHGLVFAEAFGIPATWVKYSDNIHGGTFKYHDYLTGTNRRVRDYGELPKIKNLAKIQQGLIDALLNGLTEVEL